MESEHRPDAELGKCVAEMHQKRKKKPDASCYYSQAYDHTDWGCLLYKYAVNKSLVV